MAKSIHIAKIIVKGFRRHYTLFQEITEKAKIYFETANWRAHKKSSSDRVSFYDKRVCETVELLNKSYPDLTQDDRLWEDVKLSYVGYLHFHPQAELAETFYNSVFCKLFDRRYYNNNNIFVKSTLQSENLPAPISSVYESYFPAQMGLKKTIKNIISSFQFNLDYENLNRDIKLIIKRFIMLSPQGKQPLHNVRIDVLKSIFYRNKAAYIVGRVVTPGGQQPFIIPILIREKSDVLLLYVDSLLTEKKDMIVTFGFYHAYFMVQTEVPSALVHFLKMLMPDKTHADLYTAIGLHKQGKTEFYRELLNHLQKSNDRFIQAPGIPGMVMSVFTLPSFPYVFKVIRDKFAYSKDFTSKTVKERYYLVKIHDRVGRMADTLEYSDVALPKSRFSKALLSQLREEIAGSLEEDGDVIIIKHLYIERRMIPMNIYMKTATDEEKSELMNEFGKAIKDMMGVNIFPGDMLMKNFGITPFKRVIFYDYDEVEYLVDVNFRKIPKPRTIEDEMSAQPWYSVGAHDVFPEEFPTFLTPQADLKKLLLEKHADLIDAKFWQQKQENIRQGVAEDIFPYPQKLRFTNLYPEEYTSRK
jgi:isocitrate dehydrogenase kinase/phosphatase